MKYYRKASSTLSGRTPANEVGAALIVAMFVLAVAMSMITALSMDSIVAARRADNQLLADQAWFYLTGAEELAVELLKRRREAMAQEPAENIQLLDVTGQFPTDDGWLAFDVIDLQGRFNLHSLSSGALGEDGRGQAGLPGQGGDPAEQGGLVRDGSVEPSGERSIAEQRFMALLRGTGDGQLAEQDAVAIVEAITDWVDRDVLETGFGGAEQSYYGQQPVPYRPADGPLQDVSELLLIKGITPELYQRLRDEVTVWPQTGGSLNIASIQPAMILALSAQRGAEPMQMEAAQAIRQAVGDQEIVTMNDFISRPEWGPTPLAAEGLAVRSDVFLVTSQTQVGRLRQGLDSVVQFDNNKARILARSLKML